MRDTWLAIGGLALLVGLYGFWQRVPLSSSNTPEVAQVAQNKQSIRKGRRHDPSRSENINPEFTFKRKSREELTGLEDQSQETQELSAIYPTSPARTAREARRRKQEQSVSQKYFAEASSQIQKKPSKKIMGYPMENWLGSTPELGQYAVTAPHDESLNVYVQCVDLQKDSVLTPKRCRAISKSATTLFHPNYNVE